jgi:phospholipid transport system substrate-binding protein
MRFRFSFIALLAAVFFTAPVKAETSAEGEAFVRVVADEVITILKTAQTREDREAQFSGLLTEKANLRRIGDFTLGSFRRRVSGDDLENFHDLFKNMIVKVYANRLGGYTEQKIKILGSSQKKKNILVETELVFTDGRDPISMVWRLYREKDGRLTLFDLRVLGVWMALEQREAFGSLLKNNNEDFNVLLSHLTKQINSSLDDPTNIAAN